MPAHPSPATAITAMQDFFEDLREDHRNTGYTTAIPSAAVTAVDSLHRKIILSNARVVAIAAPHHDDATREISRMLCHSFAASGINTLFVDASAELDDADELDAWVPGEPIGITRSRGRRRPIPSMCSESGQRHEPARLSTIPIGSRKHCVTI